MDKLTTDSSIILEIKTLLENTHYCITAEYALGGLSNNITALRYVRDISDREPK